MNKNFGMEISKSTTRYAAENKERNVRRRNDSAPNLKETTHSHAIIIAQNNLATKNFNLLIHQLNDCLLCSPLYLSNQCTIEHKKTFNRFDQNCYAHAVVIHTYS